jgi:hypothetical protein
VLPGVEPKLSYLRAIALPGAEYLAARGRDGRGHFAHAARRLRRAFGTSK